MTYKKYEKKEIHFPTFKCEELCKNVYALYFKTFVDMGYTFIRFQEHYESPEFKGKYFSLDQYKEWYMASKKTDKFTYVDDWGGYNIPSEVLKPFYDGFFDPLSEYERQLLELFKDKKDTKFYIIGLTETNNAQKHELGHALFYTSSEYKKEVEEVLRTIEPITLKIFTDEFASTLGYHPDVFMDEIQAYLLTVFDNSTFINRIIKRMNPEQKLEIKMTSETLNDIFNRYYE